MKRVSFGRAAVRCWLVGLCAVLSAGRALAQSVSARVEGVVTDSTGASIPGATVTATNLGTSAARNAVSDASGNYAITPLPVGAYKVKVELTGFKPSIAGLTLTVNEVARIDFKLEIGQVAEAVDVTAAAPIIEKSTSFIGTVIDSKQVENLPLNGRNFTQLATLSPGVTRGVLGGQASGSRNETETFRYNEVGGGAISVNGLREQFNNFLLDGLDNNETLVNSIVFFPSVEALQEFRVITTNAPAEFGRAGGAITNLVTKSGSNEFHGSAYEFNRSKALAATPTFSKKEDKPDLSRNQFGFSLGGPLVKDKTFFFLDYAGLQQDLPVDVGRKTSVPTDKMRHGDFSELLDPTFTGIGAPIIVYDPVTNQPFPGNIIPADRLDPVGVAYMSSFPLPDIPGKAQQNHTTHRQRLSRFHDADLRIDHIFNGNDSLFLRVSYAHDRNTDTGLFDRFESGFGAGVAQAKGLGIGVGETHTFSANVVNEVRAGFNSFEYEFLPVGFGEDQNKALGIPGPGGRTLPNGQSLIGAFNTFFEYRGDYGEYVVRQKTLQLSDSVTWIRGGHNWKLGGTLMHRDLETTRDQVGKGFYFFSGFVSTPGHPPPPGQTGYEVSEVLVGKTDFTQAGNADYAPRFMRSWENSLFIQDDWRVSRKLTLNLGLRYDVFTPYDEKQNRLANLDPATGHIVLAGQGGASPSTVDTDWNNLGPRVGFACLLGGKTALRGGYGILYSLDRGGIDNQLIENPPFKNTQFRPRSEPGGSIRLSDPIPLPTPVDPANPDGKKVVYVPKDTKTTRVQQYSIGFQRELGSTTALMVAYVGTRGDNVTAVLSKANVVTVRNVARTRYHSLQTSLRRNPSHGLSYLASYTLGHARNNAPGPLANVPLADTPTDRSGTGLDEGDADYDVRHRFTLAATYELPFAKGNAVLGGWSINTIVTLQSGTPFSVTAGDKRADFVAGRGPNGGPRTTDQWFDTGAFAAPAGPLGTSGRNVLRGPGFHDVDASFFKTFKTGGSKALEIRIEGFNVFNHPQYRLPGPDNKGANFGQADFGKITFTRDNSERQFQLAARFSF